jgi:hypothetical protein
MDVSCAFVSWMVFSWATREATVAHCLYTASATMGRTYCYLRRLSSLPAAAAGLEVGTWGAMRVVLCRLNLSLWGLAVDGDNEGDCLICQKYVVLHSQAWIPPLVCMSSAFQ